MVKNLLNLFFPPLCLACDDLLQDNERLICTFCRNELPVANFGSAQDNELIQRLYGRVALQGAVALLWFYKKSTVQHMLHHLKYKGQEELGMMLGQWLGPQLLNYPQFNDVDVVVPVPLHARRLRQRGYNQVHLFGQQLAFALNCAYNDQVLHKAKPTQTQVFKDRLRRLMSDQTVFMVTDRETLKNQHILLVDDIVTTGSTIESCAQSLLKIEGIKLSVAVMAIAE